MRRALPCLLFLITALVIFAGCNSAERFANKPVATATPVTPSDGVRRITVTELRDLVAKNEAFIVDVRTADAYKVGHIHGAKLIPTSDILNHVNELPKDKLIVTYCS